MKRWWAGMIAGAVWAAGACAQSTGPAASEPVHDAAFWRLLREHLSLATQAQRDLKETTPADREKLKALGAAAGDAEIKAQLLSRVEAINEETALAPEPLSMDLKDATLNEVTEALAKATDVPVATWPPNGRGRGGTFTLKCEGKSFWEIFALLSEQHPLRLQSYNGLRLQEAQPGYTRFFPIAPGMVICPLEISRSHSFDMQHEAGKEESPPSLALSFAVGVDPRLRVLKYAPPVLDEVKDDAGNELLKAVDEEAGNIWDNHQGQCFFEQNRSMPAPATLGKILTMVKGHVTFQVALAVDKVEVDPKEVLKKPFMVGEQAVTISTFKVEEGSINFEIQSPGGGDKGIDVTFVDANGQHVWSTQMRGATSGTVGGQYVEPVKVQLSMATKVKVVRVPFEMKDLPVP